MMTDPQAERIDDEYPLQVVALSARRACEFFGFNPNDLASIPKDMGAPKDAEKFLPGARVWGFSREQVRRVDAQPAQV
jgi:hypothetical protein